MAKVWQPGRYADEVRVIPGPHEVKIRISKSLVYPGGGRLISEGLDIPETSAGFRFLTFRFDTRPGHTYKVDLPIYWRKNSIIKITDEATKEIVASQVVN